MLCHSNAEKGKKKNMHTQALQMGIAEMPHGNWIEEDDPPFGVTVAAVMHHGQVCGDDSLKNSGGM